MPRYRQKASKGAVAKQDRDLKALQLRVKGYDYEEIAKELGLSHRSVAWRGIMKALEQRAAEMSKLAEEAIPIELERLDAMWKGVWDDATSGDPKAVDAAIKIMGRRARLLGLDAPVKSQNELSGAVQVASPVIMVPPERSNEESTGLNCDCEGLET